MLMRTHCAFLGTQGVLCLWVWCEVISVCKDLLDGPRAWTVRIGEAQNVQEQGAAATTQ